MPLLRNIAAGIRSLFQKKRADRELDEELRGFMDMAAEESMKQGRSEKDALRAVRLERGSLEAAKELVRSAGWESLLEMSWRDLRYGVRILRKSPGFTITAILSLALGIGAATAIFSLVYAVLLHPFPYKDTNRIVYVELQDRNGRYSQLLVSGDQAGEIRKLPTVENVVFQTGPQPRNLRTENAPVTVNAAYYSPNLFTLLGVPPLLGREFTSADAPDDNPAAVAVLSYQLWQEQFAGNREVIGKTIELDQSPYTVIGVMPPRFAWCCADVYLPGTPSADPQYYWSAFPKLRPGTNLRAAKSQFQVLVDRFAKENPQAYPGTIRLRLVTFDDALLGSAEGVIADLFAAALFLLIIGCANVSILLLARGTARQREFAVRTFVGAARGRLIRQLLIESVLLSVTGAVLGILTAYEAVNIIRGILPSDLLPSEIAIRLNAPVLLFSALIAVLTGILFGIWPALEFSRPPLASALHSGGTNVTGGARVQRMQRLPIAGQVCLTLLLLAGAGGATKALLARMEAPHGFDPHNVFCMRIELPTPTASTKPSRPQIEQLINQQEMIQQITTETPGVADAAFAPPFRFPKIGLDEKVEIQSNPMLATAHAVATFVSSQLLSVLRLPLLRGRTFNATEEQGQGRVAMVNEAFVRDYLPHTDAVGQRIRLPFLKMLDHYLLSASAPNDWIEVIGIVGDATNDDFDHPGVRPAIFLPYTYFLGAGRLYVRTTVDPQTEIRTVEARLRQFNSGVIVLDAYTLQWALDNWGWGRERLVAAVIAFYAGIALALAATGLYGVVSFAVTQRTQELGIRVALGAGRAAVLRVVLSSSIAMLSIGIMSGLVISALLAPLVAKWGGGKLTDPVVLLVAALILSLVALAACYLPARRAMRVDPMVALRYE